MQSGLHSTAKVTSKGQITIPKEVRELLGIQTGSVILFEQEEERVVIHPARTIRDYKGYLSSKAKGIDSDEMRRATKEAVAKRVMKDAKS